MRHYNNSDSLQPLKNAVWAYFLLLLFEGALRKWFLPALSAPLLIVRDPIAIWLIYKIWVRGMLPNSATLYGMLGLGSIAIITALIFGHGNLPVALFGARILLIHFPMIYVIGVVFNRDDVTKLGKVLLWISIPMTILVAAQFYSPQSAFVNHGVGGDTSGAGYSGAMGYLRPPGTFSFTNGINLFYGILASYILYFLISGKEVNKLLLFGATVSLVAAIPLSLSRGLAFQASISLLFALFLVFRSPKNILRFLLAGMGIAIILLIISNFNFFQKAMEAFTYRFTTASFTEGGLQGTLVGRYLGNMRSAVTDALEQPFFGYGIGMGTNVGSVLLTGSRKFLIAEEEWARLIGEMGAFLGFSVIIVRLILSLKLTFYAYKFVNNGDVLAWMLLSFGLTIIPQGQWAQPTALGFSVLVGGLIIASFKPAQVPAETYDAKIESYGN